MNTLAYALGRGRVTWLLGLSVLAIGSQALMRVAGVAWLPHPQIVGSPRLAFALLLSLALELLLWILAVKLAAEALRAGTSGRVDREETIGDAQALRHVLLWLGLSIAAWFAWRSGGMGALVIFVLGTVLALPAVLSLLTFEDSLWRAFDPRAWWGLLARVQLAYAACAGRLLGLALAAGAVSWALLALPAWVQAFPIRFVQWFALVAGYHAVGRMLARESASLGLPAADAISRPQLASFEEDEAMREAEALALEDPAAGAARLAPLIRGRGGSAPIHARYREWLEAAGDIAALQAHARGHVAVLLALGQDRQALALYLSARARDPDFELAEPQELAQLITVADRVGQVRLAVALADEFVRRFPRVSDAPEQALRAARLLGTRLGLGDEAGERLRAWIATHADHPRVADARKLLADLPVP